MRRSLRQNEKRRCFVFCARSLLRLLANAGSTDVVEWYPRHACGRKTRGAALRRRAGVRLPSAAEADVAMQQSEQLLPPQPA
jgi:hypothetical protein